MFVRAQAFLLRLEARPHSWTGLIVVCGFTGFVRSLEEFLFFGERLNPAMGLAMLLSYFQMAIGLIAGLSALTGTPWKRTQNSVYLGIFLGTFPPLIDLALSGMRAGLTYRYFTGTGLETLPWHFYDPAQGVPSGETATVWLSIAFCAVYVFTKTGSTLKTLLGLAGAYLFFLFQFAFLPLWIRKMVSLGEASQTAGVRASDLALALIPFWYIYLSMFVYCAMRPVILSAVKRWFWHLLPFSLITICGGYFTGGLTTPVLMAGWAVFVVCVAIGIQNDYFDARAGEHAPRVSREDVGFFNIIVASFILWLFTIGQNPSLTLAIFFAGGILYNYPQFRIKKFFPGSLKIEGMWAAMGFLTGVLIFDRSLVRPAHFIATLLVFGGWSLIASWKDLKDIRRDRRLKYENFYTFLMRRGFSLSKAHRLISSLCVTASTVPAIYALATSRFLASGILFVTGGIIIAALSFKPRIKNWFRYVLMVFSALLIECLIFLKI